MCNGDIGMEMDRPVLIRLKDISFGYPGMPLILDQLNFELRQGDRIGLLGHNGSGKTTFFHLIMGLLKPIAGTIEIFGKVLTKEKDFQEIRTRIGLLFQDSEDQLFSPTVIEDVAFGPLNLGKSKTDALNIAKQTLEYLGLNGFEDRLTYKLSGGEKRLVSLATILSMNPDVLLLDEPTTGLDDKTKQKIITILSELPQSYIVISHEMEFLESVTHAIYTMENGKINTDRKLIFHQHIHAHYHGSHPHEHN